MKLSHILDFRFISGMGEGEKTIVLKDAAPLIFLCNDFVSAGKYKRCFGAMGKKCEIITTCREVGKENDFNLMPYAAALASFLKGKTDILLVLPCSAMTKFSLKEFLNPILLKTGEEFDTISLCQTLAGLGYSRADLVSREGEFALRGDILDIFMPGEENAVRVEFFGDEIEKVHAFDLATMKNQHKLDEIMVYPAYLPEGDDGVFDLKGMHIMDEPKRIEDEMEMLLKSYEAMSGFSRDNYLAFTELYNKADNIFTDFKLSGATAYENHRLPQRSYLTDFMALKNDLQQYLKMNFKVLLYAGSDKNKQKLQEFLNENNLVFHDYEKEEFEEGKIFVSEENFPLSYSFMEERVVAIGRDSLFRQSETSFSKSRHAVFYLPKLGDYVVHTFHGIGRCVKIERLKLGDYEKDYFVIEYKNGGTLYLPSEQADTISAYVGGETEPKLSALGGGEFSRLKERVKAGLRQMAISLTALYKEREQSKGFAFKKDEFLDKKFADEFPFTETPDQLKAISDIEKDMESPRIMDRLICGDVGFGKTEVALRACFKCIYNGRQVALLCPTTILSEQHYRTAKARFEGFGAKVEVLNRFKTTAQVKDILARVKEGQVDMLIGTHRLLGKDVQFKDLGLLVLDEEQRFGVEDKEKIKDSKRTIDVLTMSATPIPRTLNMSLSGIRDISVIETPPKDRLPIQTYVAEQTDSLVKDVLSREIARGGQAFVIYNRVESIHEFASYIHSLLPSARIGIAHGQMPERELENVINDMFDGKFDIFISTTLIENGVDLPTANTMIIMEADRLGLSQLYQIRGRIGRSDRLSYAYLLYDKDKLLTEDAYKRLSAIKEFSTLGSGFKIAMRDLEIRGAGNIFGKEQHGHIAKVGYDMYVKLLDEAVSELKGESTVRASEVKLEINLDAFISEDYITSSDERILMYTKISSISSRQEIENLLESLEDGFGQPSQEVKNLCLLAYLKNLASKFNVVKIRVNSAECSLTFEKSEQIIPASLAVHISEYGGAVSYTSLPKINFKIEGGVLRKVNLLIKFLEEGNKIK